MEGGDQNESAVAERERRDIEESHNILAERFKTIEEEDDKVFLTNNADLTRPREETR